jgi:hypothetical protein
MKNPIQLKHITTAEEIKKLIDFFPHVLPILNIPVFELTLADILTLSTTGVYTEKYNPNLYSIIIERYADTPD